MSRCEGRCEVQPNERCELTAVISHGRRSGCGDRKRTYETIQEARIAAAYSWSRSGCNLAVYRCPTCGKFHLTHILKGVHNRLEKVRFVQNPNFSGGRTEKMKDGWNHEGVIPKTEEDIALERAEFLKRRKEAKARLNRTRRRIRWKDREESDDMA